MLWPAPQVQKMHDAEGVQVPEQRVTKRRKTSPEIAASKTKPAISASRWCASLLVCARPVTFHRLITGQSACTATHAVPCMLKPD